MSEQLSWFRRMLAVLCGGFCGTVTRYGLSLFIQSWLGKGWPYDIFLINISGALLLAFVTALAEAAFLIGPTRRLFINIGFLGAYTTFSSLALGDVLLLTGGQLFLAILYFFASLIGGLLAVLVGDLLGSWFVRSLKSSSWQKAFVRRQDEVTRLVQDMDNAALPERRRSSR